MGTSLLRVLATDADGQDNVISYRIINRETNVVNFSVDSNGVISNDGRFPSIAGGTLEVRILTGLLVHMPVTGPYINVSVYRVWQTSKFTP